MKVDRLVRGAAAAITMGLGAQMHAQGSAAATACGSAAHCTETRNIAAQVTDFRFSTGGNGLRILTATVRFTNKTTHALTLGYVSGSGVATDDQGNRYAVFGASGVSAIGVITGSGADTKFSLQPGESSDARFELGWRPEAHRIYGTSYALEQTVREIDPVGTSQYRLGAEHALRFPGLSTDAGALGASVVASPAAASPTGANGPAQPAGESTSACSAVARCYDAGAFTAAIASITPSVSGRHRIVSMTIRLTNHTTQPLILAYTQSSSTMSDNLGNQYYWGRAGSHDQSVQGIGLVSRTSADPQLVLQPGESRDARFRMIAFDAANKPAGTSFVYDVSLEQLQVLPSQQIRSVRQYAIHFDGLAAGGANARVQTVSDAVSKLKGLLRRP